ncbi:MAG: hypothetical protein OEU32_08640, partial [Acidimicrobiia bacterium]|nr:hypothetical protein [Acidimicrobiia bacterium]
RLSKRHLGMAANLATVYDPEGAVDAGFLDRLADDPVEAAIQHAAMLAETLHPAAFQVTRDRLRGESAELIRARIADDLATFTVG